jgi:hypothetical protein
VLLAATHSIAVLVRTRAGGLTYWCALLMTLALASCAIVLSFDALRSLAVTLGLPEAIAWLWPCAIDVAIAQATLCLLSLSRRADIDNAKGVAAEAVAPTVSANHPSPQAEPVQPEPTVRAAVRSGGNSTSRDATAGDKHESLSAAVGPADVESCRNPRATRSGYATQRHRPPPSGAPHDGRPNPLRGSDIDRVARYCRSHAGPRLGSSVAVNPYRTRHLDPVGVGRAGG